MADDLFDEDDDWEDELDDDEPSTTFSVSEVANTINDVLGEAFDRGIWVWGEVTGLSTKNGHTYFSLVEATPSGGKAQLSVNLWAGVMTKLRPVLKRSGVTLENGVKVRVFGSLDFYAPFGKISLNMRDIDPRFTLGDIALQREELIRRLRESGDYDRNRELELSPAPLRVGVVTSESSAAWADFRHEIERSGLGFHLRLADVRVQGESAVRDVTSAIRSLGLRDDIDVIAVVRGGGSRAELATFDAEEIARAIASSPLPVVTGIGHEIDTSIADEVAHERFKTPTACAAGLVERVNAFVTSTEEAWDSIARLATEVLGESNSALRIMANQIASRTRSAVDRAEERLGFRSARLHTSVASSLVANEVRVLNGRDRLRRRLPQVIERSSLQVGGLEARVRLLDPRELMKRGWSVTRTASGLVVRSVSDVVDGDLLTTQLPDGTITSTVGAVVPEDGRK